MRQFLEAVWKAPKEEFTWFMGVMWDQFLYVVVVILVLRWLWRLSGKPPDVGHFFMAIDPEIFMPLTEFTIRVDRMIEQAKTGEGAKDVEEILIPGEAELRAREENIQKGVPLRPVTYRALLKHGGKARLNTELVVVH